MQYKIPLLASIQYTTSIQPSRQCVRSLPEPLCRRRAWHYTFSALDWHLSIILEYNVVDCFLNIAIFPTFFQYKVSWADWCLKSSSLTVFLCSICFKTITHYNQLLSFAIHVFNHCCLPLYWDCAYNTFDILQWTLGWYSIYVCGTIT